MGVKDWFFASVTRNTPFPRRAQGQPDTPPEEATPYQTDQKKNRRFPCAPIGNHLRTDGTKGDKGTGTSTSNTEAPNAPHEYLSGKARRKGTE